MAHNTEENKVRSHEYDGIQEYDNALPRWWVGLFVFGIVFGVIYFVYMHVIGAPTLADEMRIDQAKLTAMHGSTGGSGGTPDQGAAAGGGFAERIKDKAVIAEGKVVYDTNCSPCHGAEGQGVVGPNLTDTFWINGGAPTAILHTVLEGVPEKGMISWKPVIGEKKAEQAVAYLLTFQGTHPANAKPAEGTEYKGQ